ncbi:hypothetical protein [Planctomyces sp. SH-PL14]|uniref:hypothetical protein n=1 Tax=Planctomyces sp. SH-PL14 TaxID=1632864 RepID=UPI00078D2B0C|nr:hypothetical protein [Planctomyces sp. SH-PL14]AMV19172.1 hypothetical protein VT03_14880 [Planctomyces sp. SH-PL14]
MTVAWANPSLSLRIEQVVKHSCRLANDVLSLRRGSRNGDLYRYVLFVVFLRALRLDTEWNFRNDLDRLSSKQFLKGDRGMCAHEQMFARDHEHTVRGHNAEEHAYNEAKFGHRKGVP